MRFLMVFGVLLLVAACTPADQEYCNSFGVGGTAEYGKCINYFHQQEARFGADRSVCEFEADATYPPSLYDYGHYEHVIGGFGPMGTMYGGSTIRVEPDYYHNAQVDRLRMRIIEPCMQRQGWNSGSDWRQGEHPVSLKPVPASAAPLPWLR